MSAPRRTVAVIGGSGISGIFEPGTTQSHKVSTPWGAPSGPIEEGTVAGSGPSSSRGTDRATRSLPTG